MEYSFGSRLKHAWNAFMNRDPTAEFRRDIGPGYSARPDRVKLRVGNERSIISSIYTRIAIDVAETTICHARMDDNGKFLETINSGLNECLTVEANIDQTSKAFLMDAVLSMFDEGVVAIVPVDTTMSPINTGSYEINSLRTGKIVDWYPEHVKVRLYNDRTGNKEEIILPKKTVAIVENPFYSVMNEPNSTLRRLVYKLNLLDAVDEQSSSGKLDLIIQLPYVVKSETRRDQAMKRRKEIEEQLTGSKYGIAYTDGTERITQLNRSVDNNLMNQIEYLTTMLYSQLGLTQSVFDGTATNEVLTNYYSRTVAPIVAAFANEMKRKFLTKTARSQNQSIFYFSDPFKFVPVAQIADIADKFTRNEIMSSNEVRQIVGMKASEDPRADELRNKNLSEPKEANDEVYEDPEEEYGHY
ncbi:MAG: phage portal protein [Prevotellaceae bacterium]|nr:phage portal protein [Prevotellaceae bacterium]